MSLTASPARDQSTETTADAPAARRLLLVTYCFPPDRRVGALRWLRLLPTLMSGGWRADVITLDPDWLPRDFIDDSALHGGSLAAVRTFGVPHPRNRPQIWHARLVAPIRRFLAWRRARKGVRPEPPVVVPPGGTLMPRPRRGMPLFSKLATEYRGWMNDGWYRTWGRLADVRGQALIERDRYDVVISSGPPHIAHVVAAKLAARAGIPHVADLRDPWSRGHRVDDDVDGQLARWRQMRDERWVFRRARLVICNTLAMQALYTRLYPSFAPKLITVMNGSDEEPLPPTAHGDRFVALFAGSVYIDRDPTPLFLAAARVVAELGLTPAEFGVQLVGEVDRYRGTSVREIAKRTGVSDYVTLSPPVPRRDVAELYARAQVLVNLPQDSMTQIPAKTFEYVRAASWVLVFTPAGSAADLLLREAGADVVGLDDIDRAAEVLRNRYLQFRAGERPTPLNADGRFSRSTQAAHLARALDAITEPAAATEESEVASPPEITLLGRGKQWARGLGVTNALAIGAFSSLTVRTLGMAIALAVQGMLARRLGQGGYGHYVYVLAWMNVVLLLVKLEYDISGVRFVGAYQATARWGMLRGFLRKTQGLVLASSTAAAIVALGVLLALRDRIEPDLWSTSMWACALLVPTAVLTLQGGFLQGFQRMVSAQAPVQLIRPAIFGVTILAVSAVVGARVVPWGAVAANVFATLFALAISSYYLRREIPTVTRGTPPEAEWSLWLRTARGMVAIAAAQLLISAQSDVLVVGTLLSTYDAALYSTASQIAALVVFGASAVTTIAVPQVASLFAAHRFHDLQRLLRLMAIATTLVTLPILAITLAGGKLLLALFGPTFVAGYGVLVILSFSQTVTAILGIMGGFLMTMTGHEHQAAIIVGGSALINLVLTIALTHLYGINGTAAATLIATLLRGIALAIFAQRKLGLQILPFLAPRRPAFE